MTKILKPAANLTSPTGKELRFGWTTGTCATAATYGAYMGLISGAFPQNVEILTPSGKTAKLTLSYQHLEAGTAAAGVIKDAGDDPDVTHGAEIRSSVRVLPQGSGIVFRGGDGVGFITKAGLPLPVGEPAINPVPRQMITDCINSLAAQMDGPGDIEVTISVPSGAALALKTWNPRLGIMGGISILGTTGVVRPYSCSAWIASIHRGIDVARANDLPHVAGSTGATSEQAVQLRYGLADTALLDMGDFAGGMLKYLRRHPVPRLTIAGGFAKMVKLAQGHIDLHSARSQVNFPALGLMAEDVGLDPDFVTNANSTLEVIQSLDSTKASALSHLVGSAALETVRGILRGTEIETDILIVGRDGKILAEVNA